MTAIAGLTTAEIGRAYVEAVLAGVPHIALAANVIMPYEMAERILEAAGARVAGVRVRREAGLPEGMGLMHDTGKPREKGC